MTTPKYDYLKNENELKVEKRLHIEDSSLAELIQAQSYLFTL